MDKNLLNFKSARIDRSAEALFEIYLNKSCHDFKYYYELDGLELGTFIILRKNDREFPFKITKIEVDNSKSSGFYTVTIYCTNSSSSRNCIVYNDIVEFVDKFCIDRIVTKLDEEYSAINHRITLL